VNSMKVGVIFAKKGQINPVEEMFKNNMDDSEGGIQFVNFLNLMGYKINIKGWNGFRGDFSSNAEVTTYYENWNNIEIIYHIAPWLNTDEQRRFIGNDIAVIVMVEASATKYDPSNMDKLGTVPQIIVVAQPVLGDAEVKYRLFFLSRKNLNQCMPLAPMQALDATTSKNLILTKLHNCLVISKRCPPFDRLFQMPRGQFISDIVKKFPPTKKKKGKTQQQDKNTETKPPRYYFFSTIK